MVPFADETCEDGGHVPGAFPAVVAHAIEDRDIDEAVGAVVAVEDVLAVGEEEGLHLLKDLLAAAEVVGI